MIKVARIKNGIQPLSPENIEYIARNIILGMERKRKKVYAVFKNFPPLSQKFIKMIRKAETESKNIKTPRWNFPLKVYPNVHPKLV